MNKNKNELQLQIGENVRQCRDSKGLTQEELAEKLDFNCRSLSFIECGTNFVTADTLEKLCLALSVTPKQLFDFEFYPENPADMKKELSQMIDNNSEKLADIYNILKGFLS